MKICNIRIFISSSSSKSKKKYALEDTIEMVAHERILGGRLSSAAKNFHTLWNCLVLQQQQRSAAAKQLSSALLIISWS